MKYVLQETNGRQKGHYVYADIADRVTIYLCRARLFKSRSAAAMFRIDTYWAAHYVVIEVTEQQLFKAELAHK